PGIGVALQQPHRLGSDRLRERLRTQIGRPDGVGFIHDRGASRLVPTDGHRESEGEDQRDEPDQRGLDDSERLPEPLPSIAEVATECDPDEGGPHHDDEDHDRELERAEPKEQPTGLPGDSLSVGTRLGCYAATRTVRSCTTYAMISASGKKNRLRTKYPKKLCPFRPATRAGQNANATQMMIPMIPIPIHMMVS